MKEVILCCEMLRDELALAMEHTGCTTPITWVDSGLHEYPERLRAQLERQIGELEREYDTILLGFALCGNALVGVGAQRATLVAPRTDDCIRMLMHLSPDEPPQVDCHCLYYTSSWVDREAFISREYARNLEKYGEKKAKRIYKSMLRNYTGMRLIDTGAPGFDGAAELVRGAASLLELEYGETTGSIRVLEKLLRHDWDGEFYVLPPGEKFEQLKFLSGLQDAEERN